MTSDRFNHLAASAHNVGQLVMSTYVEVGSIHCATYMELSASCTYAGRYHRYHGYLVSDLFPYLWNAKEVDMRHDQLTRD